jgi:hypothetical protein
MGKTFWQVMFLALVGLGQVTMAQDLSVDVFKSKNESFINTDTYCATRNWQDGGKIYQYKILGGRVFKKIENGDWVSMEPMPGYPKGRTAKNIAADNNRLFVLTKDADGVKLYWCCLRLDYAGWVVGLIDVGLQLPSSVGSLIAGQIGNITLDRYKKYVIDTHQEGTWNELVKVEERGNLAVGGMPRDGIPCMDSIKDIAVGNWNNTVVTFYVLVHMPPDANHIDPYYEIRWIDEEPLTKEWKSISSKDHRIPLLHGKITFQNSPYPYITKQSRINASNSVIAVSVKDQASGKIRVHWMRFDYHHQPSFTMWPLVDWTDDEWSTYTQNTVVDKPNVSPYNFYINTNFFYLNPVLPIVTWKPWKTPSTNILNCGDPVPGEEGMFGDVPRETVFFYPVMIHLPSRYYGSTIQQCDIIRAKAGAVEFTPEFCTIPKYTVGDVYIWPVMRQCSLDQLKPSEVGVKIVEYLYSSSVNLGAQAGAATVLTFAPITATVLSIFGWERTVENKITTIKKLCLQKYRMGPRVFEYGESPPIYVKPPFESARLDLLLNNQ